MRKLAERLLKFKCVLKLPENGDKGRLGGVGRTGLEPQGLVLTKPVISGLESPLRPKEGHRWAGGDCVTLKVKGSPAGDREDGGK